MHFPGSAYIPGTLAPFLALDLALTRAENSEHPRVAGPAVVRTVSLGTCGVGRMNGPFFLGCAHHAYGLATRGPDEEVVVGCGVLDGLDHGLRSPCMRAHAVWI